MYCLYKLFYHVLLLLIVIQQIQSTLHLYLIDIVKFGLCLYVFEDVVEGVGLKVRGIRVAYKIQPHLLVLQYQLFKTQLAGHATTAAAT